MWPYPAPLDDGAADHLHSGTKLPDVSLTSTIEENVSLAKQPGNFILFVYPWTGRAGFSNPNGWDHIPGAHGSTAEAEGFRDLYQNYKQKGFCIFGMSAQSTNWQRELSERLQLSYALLSDEGFFFSDALRLPSFSIEGVKFLKRLTLVCAEGKIIQTVYPVHPPDRHAYDLLSGLEKGSAEKRRQT